VTAIPWRAGGACLAAIAIGAAQHAQSLLKSEAESLRRMVEEARIVRHFCAPCGDSAWTQDTVRSARASPANIQSGEWALFLNGKAADAAYVYIRSGSQWKNLAHLAGLRFPDVPATLKPAPAHGGQPDSLAATFSWEGVYEFRDRVRTDKSKQAAVVAYSLQIFDRDSSLEAALFMDGIGVNRRMALDVQGRGDSLRFVLKEYLRGNYGKPLPPGAGLFTLRRLPGGAISTAWGALKPDPKSRHAPGFRRTRLNPREIEE
jgi:hypothetical protein